MPDWTAIPTIKRASISSSFDAWLTIRQGAILVSPPQVRRFLRYYWPSPSPESVRSLHPASACPTYSWRQHAASKWSEPEGTIQLAQGPKFQKRVKIQNDDNYFTSSDRRMAENYPRLTINLTSRPLLLRIFYHWKFRLAQKLAQLSDTVLSCRIFHIGSETFLQVAPELWS